MKKFILILIGLILIITGAFLYFQNKSDSEKQIINNLTKKSSSKTIPTSSSTPILANFHETGTVLSWDENSEASSSAWIFLYETENQATQSARLVFDEDKSMQLENGDQVKLSAFKKDQIITVINLEKIISDQLEGDLP